MKGVIFTEFVEMLASTYSPEFADEVLDSADLPSGGAYTAVGTYDASEVTALVRTTAERVGRTEPEVLRDFGQALFSRLAALYPHLVDGQPGAFSFLERISWLHYSEVVKLYPDGQFPAFEVTSPDPDRLLLTYRSRQRLADLAEGLLHGVAEHFGETLTILRDDVEPDGSVVRFTLTKEA